MLNRGYDASTVARYVHLQIDGTSIREGNMPTTMAMSIAAGRVWRTRRGFNEDVTPMLVQRSAHTIFAMEEMLTKRRTY